MGGGGTGASGGECVSVYDAWGLAVDAYGLVMHEAYASVCVAEEMSALQDKQDDARETEAEAEEKRMLEDIYSVPESLEEAQRRGRMGSGAGVEGVGLGGALQVLVWGAENLAAIFLLHPGLRARRAMEFLQATNTHTHTPASPADTITRSTPSSNADSHPLPAAPLSAGGDGVDEGGADGGGIDQGGFVTGFDGSPPRSAATACQDSPMGKNRSGHSHGAWQVLQWTSQVTARMQGNWPLVLPQEPWLASLSALLADCAHALCLPLSSNSGREPRDQGGSDLAGRGEMEMRRDGTGRGGGQTQTHGISLTPGMTTPVFKEHPVLFQEHQERSQEHQERPQQVSLLPGMVTPVFKEHPVLLPTPQRFRFVSPRRKIRQTPRNTFSKVLSAVTLYLVNVLGH